jgi:Ca-activated chloride channel family protein
MLQKLLNGVEFEWPWALWLLAFLPLFGWLMLSKKGNIKGSLRVSELSPLTQGYNLKTALRNMPNFLRLLAMAFMILAIARPVRKQTIEINSGKGIEIVLCLDVSGSMLAQDFTPNRLLASQKVAREFVNRRKGDRIGLVVFAGQSLTLCPITTDHKALLYQLETINYGILKDGTSIGSGLASSVERLRTGQAASKIVVLLTDGEDTGGKMDPVTAKEIAKTFGIKVYTIGVGTEGYANIPYQSITGESVLEKEKVSIDEVLLKTIAAETGGSYFRAKNTEELENIYSEIDTLEKSDIRTTVFNKTHDAFFPFLGIALGLLLLEWILLHTWLRRFP